MAVPIAQAATACLFGVALVEVAQGGDDEREGEEHCHQRAQAGDGEASPSGLGFESNHGGEPADDHDSRGDRAGAPKAEVESVTGE